MLNAGLYCIIPPLFHWENATILTSTRLSWQELQPNIAEYADLFSRIAEHKPASLVSVQPRLLNALTHLHQQADGFPLLLLCTQECDEYLALLAQQMQQIVGNSPVYAGGRYQIEAQQVTLLPADDSADPFIGRGKVAYADWIENFQLFGCVRHQNGRIQLEPGLIHQANGGTLVLSLRTLQMQPLLWLRLKRAIQSGRLEWQSADERYPLPVAIPALPLKLKLILCGDRDALATFQEDEPALHELATYSEFEETQQIMDGDDLLTWCCWARDTAQQAGLPSPEADFWPVLLRESARYTGDQALLPLSPRWLLRQMREASMQESTLSGAALAEALALRSWRETFLSERLQDEILLNQVLIETQGEVIGQINGLSVVEYPGHPRAWGEPSRISCVVQPGDGEFTDVERKAELGGNIHAKGMMIMQAYLIAELELDQPLPFSASLVFEQSYSEVDGDSASLAELCALISALSEQPINQQIAVTGSVDQFGNIQPVGGLNEKIEGFFTVCQARELTGQQGVIIPASNARHLSLSEEVITAVEQNRFNIWTIERAEEALPLLTGAIWRSDEENGDTLLNRIKERITRLEQADAPVRRWPFRWLNWFNQR